MLLRIYYVGPVKPKGWPVLRKDCAPQQSEFFLTLASRSSVFGATHHHGDLCCVLASNEILLNKMYGGSAMRSPSQRHFSALQILEHDSC